MEKTSKIYVAGHHGLVGSSIYTKLKALGYSNVIVKNREDLDLTRQDEVEAFFKSTVPEYVFMAAAKVGGIYANKTYPAQFIRDNLMIQTNTLHAAYQTKVKKVLFLGSSCIYPKFAHQPMTEESLLSDHLEPTNEAYAIAKISGLKMCRYYNEQYGTNFLSVMPTNLYGPNDNFHAENSHVIPGLIKRFHDAKINKTPEVTVWGTGKALREFLFIDDMVEACLYVMNKFNASDLGEFVNLGTGEEVSIKELTELISKVVGYTGAIKFDTTKPDGSPRKLLEVSKLKGLGWTAKTSLKNGLKQTYEWYCNNFNTESIKA